MSIEVHPSNRLDATLDNNNTAPLSPIKVQNHHEKDGSFSNDNHKDTSVTFAETDDSFVSLRSTTLLIRDTSVDGGPGGVETSRITVNTHNSILNITEEDDGDYEDEESSEFPIEKSFLFEENEDSIVGDISVFSDDKVGHRVNSTACIPQTPPACRTTWCEAQSTPSGTDAILPANKDGSMLLDFVDSLCYGGNHNMNNAKSSSSSLKTDRDVAVMCEQYQRVLEYDILELLGCSNPPDQEELNRVWQFNLATATACNVVSSSSGDACTPTGVVVSPTTTPPAPQRKAKRRHWRERAVRVHRLRTERTNCNISPSSVVPLPSRCRSMDDDLWNANNEHSKINSWAAFDLFPTTPATSQNPAGKGGLSPTSPEKEEDGYDSDPEERVVASSSMSMKMPEPPNLLESSSSSSTTPGVGFLQPRQFPVHAVVDSSAFHTDSSIVDTVQETLNMSWTVFWHPGKNDNFREPRKVQAWIERGTLVEMNTVMLEPNLMWRETFQPELETKRKLNASSQKPHAVRLLNLCRVLTDEGVDRTVYPLVRPSCCILVRTSDGQEHMFEAATIQERNDLVRRWKLTTARFATLAVLEDLETICKEFFSPMITSRMLVPDYADEALEEAEENEEEEHTFDLDTETEDDGDDNDDETDIVVVS